MTVQAMPWAIQGQSHPAENARNALAAMFGAPVAALVEGVSITTAGGAHGVVGAGDLAVTQNGTPNMSVNVAAGRAIIRSTEASSLLAGAYTFLNDGTVNVTIAASDPTNPRIDLIVAQIRDSNYSGGATDARLAAVTGTPAGSPAVPAVPDSCVVLCQIAVAALSTTVVNANITDKRTRAYALGGTAICTSTTRPSSVSVFEGLEILEIDTDRILRSDGSNWIRVSHYSPAGRTGGEWSRVANQSIATSTLTNISWDTETSDSDGFIVPHATTATTFTVPSGLGGVYAVSGNLGFATAPTGGFSRLTLGGIVSDHPASIAGQQAGFCRVEPLDAAETVIVTAFQSSGGAINVTGKIYINRVCA